MVNTHGKHPVGGPKSLVQPQDTLQEEKNEDASNKQLDSHFNFRICTLVCHIDRIRRD
jgi:hypothetical protein